MQPYHKFLMLPYIPGDQVEIIGERQSDKGHAFQIVPIIPLKPFQIQDRIEAHQKNDRTERVTLKNTLRES